MQRWLGAAGAQQRNGWEQMCWRLTRRGRNMQRKDPVRVPSGSPASGTAPPSAVSGLLKTFRYSRLLLLHLVIFSKVILSWEQFLPRLPISLPAPKKTSVSLLPHRATRSVSITSKPTALSWNEISELPHLHLKTSVFFRMFIHFDARDLFIYFTHCPRFWQKTKSSSV